MLKKVIKLQIFCCSIFLNQVTLNSDSQTTAPKESNIFIADLKPSSARTMELKDVEETSLDDEWRDVGSPTLNIASEKPAKTMSAARALAAFIQIEKGTKEDIERYGLISSPIRRKSVTKTSGEYIEFARKNSDFSEECMSNDSGFEGDSDKSPVVPLSAPSLALPATPPNTPKGPSSTPVGPSGALN